MGKTINVKTENQSGGVAVGEVTKDADETSLHEEHQNMVDVLDEERVQETDVNINNVHDTKVNTDAEFASEIEENNVIFYVPDVTLLVAGKLVANPNYRPETYVAPDGTEYSVVSDWEPGPHLREKEAVFFLNLEKSVQEGGVKYPACGFGINGRVFMKTGLSRLWAARKYEQPCPALVVDVDGSFADKGLPRVYDVASYFHGRTYRDNEAPGLGWYYTHLDDRPNMDDPRFIKDLF